MVTEALSTLSTESIDIEAKIVVADFFHIIDNEHTGNVTYGQVK